MPVPRRRKKRTAGQTPFAGRASYTGYMKVTVYAIAKNEQRFARRWAQSMAEADEIVVLDTGSDDNTAAVLAECGVKVTVRQIVPWRFDVARNESLKLVPADTDICVCTDLDEVFSPGWRAAAEKAWTGDVTRLKYRYVWSHTPDGGDGVVFHIEKMHAYGCYKWVHPVHEVLSYTGSGRESVRLAAGVRLDHYPDDAKSRAGYLPLLELAVLERPDDDRNVHYLGREYMFRGRWDDAIAMLKRHLAMPTAVWADERCASERFIARCYAAKNDLPAAESWYLRAVAEAPHLREPNVDMAALCYDKEDWTGVLWFVERALKITDRSLSYINEPLAWSSYPADIAAIACFRLGLYARSYAYAEAALALSPGDARLRGNLELIKTLL